MFSKEKNMISAAKTNNVTELKKFIDEGANVHAYTDKNKLSTHVAAETNSSDTLRFLTSRGMDVNAQGNLTIPFLLPPLFLFLQFLQFLLFFFFSIFLLFFLFL